MQRWGTNTMTTTKTDKQWRRHNNQLGPQSFASTAGKKTTLNGRSWLDDSIAQWYNGLMVQRLDDTMVQCNDTMVHGTMIRWMMAIWWYIGTRHMAQWYDGKMVWWHKGSLVRCDGTMVHGSMRRWLYGTMSRWQVQWHDFTMVRCDGKMASERIVLCWFLLW